MLANRFTSRCLIVLTASALVPLAAAQGRAAQSAPGEVEPVALDYATGELTPLAGSSDATAVCFANTAAVGLYAVPLAGEEWVDWGVMSCGLTGLVSEFTFGYATTALDPDAGGPGAALELAFHFGPSGLCALGGEMARFSFAGLPGSTDGVSVASFSVTVDVGTTPFPLLDGPIAWSYVGVDGLTGPLLVSTGGICGGAPDPLTGTVDCFDVYTPTPPTSGVCGAGASFPAAPAAASFFVAIGVEDGSASGAQTVRTGSGTNVGVLSPAAVDPTIGGTWTPSITTPAVPGPALDFLGLAVLPHPGLILPGIGEMLIGPPVVTIVGPTGSGSPFAVPVPTFTSLAGASLFAQAGQVNGLSTIGLTNAVDIVIALKKVKCSSVKPTNKVLKFKSLYANVLVSSDCPVPSADDIATAIANAVGQASAVGDALCKVLGDCSDDQECKLTLPEAAGVETSNESLPDPTNPERKNCYVVVTLSLEGKCECE